MTWASKRTWLLLGMAVALLAAALVWLGTPSRSERAERRFEEAYVAFEADRYAEAERLARRAVGLNPQRDDARLLAAKAASASQAHGLALEHCLGVSAEDPSLYAAAQLLAAELCHDWLLRLTDAQQHYQNVLEIDPQQIEANRGLARLYGETGQRHSAVAPVLRLIRSGAAGDLLMLLARDDGVIAVPDRLQRARELHPGDPLPLLGLAWFAVDSGKYDEALDLLREALRVDPQCAVATAMQGKAMAARGDRPGLLAWSRSVEPAAEALPATWLARGQLAEWAEQPRSAIGCYLRAARLQPENKTANARLSQLLANAGRPSVASAFETYTRNLQQLGSLQDRIFFASEPSGLEKLRELIQAYLTVGRLWEAFAFTQLALELAPQAGPLRQLSGQLAERLQTAPTRLVDPQLTPSRRLDPADFPDLDWQAAEQRLQPVESAEPGAATDARGFAFKASAQQLNLTFRYHNGSDDGPPRKMYEFSGGGIAVLDFDLDGWPDLCFSQGTDWPPGGPLVTDEPRDQLFRNLGGERYQWATPALIEQRRGFGQGITAGDFDGDGFADLYIAQAGGTNQLYRNNGDGTFSNVTEQCGLSGRSWTTSVVMADLDGDGLSDLYDVNYVRGKDVFERVCADSQGHPAICMPFDFGAEPDQLWRNRGDGRFVDASAEMLRVAAAGKGLGAAAFDARGDGRLGLFITNDTTPNQLLLPEPPPADGTTRTVVLNDEATSAGVAFNGAGKAEGCMGIAVDDINQDGLVDLLVTNFLFETNTLYLSRGDALFADATAPLGLAEPSINVLGFGTQFLDANLDGSPELFITNGHIDDLSRDGRPFRMHPQLFTWDGSRFTEIAAESPGEYFRETWLGRAAARLDVNRDGLADLVVGHLERHSELLVNQSQPAGNYLAVRLVGTQCSRDAIGARVTLRDGNFARQAQLTAGDGYQARNEARLLFGLGDREQIDSIEVRWPGASEVVERFPAGKVNREFLLIQGRGATVPAGDR